MSEVDPAQLMRFVLELRQAGVTDSRALSALERMPRTMFAPEHLDALALDDVGLPLPHGQTMTKPSIIGRILTLLAPQAGDSVLEIGTGSAYQAAAIATLAHKVVTLERWRDIGASAREHVGAARLMRVFVHIADGHDGWPAEAPYDRIIVNAAVPDFPQPLLDQLKPDGTMIAPLIEADGQRLVRFSNGQREDLGPAGFQALERGVGEG